LTGLFAHDHELVALGREPHFHHAFIALREALHALGGDGLILADAEAELTRLGGGRFVLLGTGTRRVEHEHAQDRYAQSEKLVRHVQFASVRRTGPEEEGRTRAWRRATMACCASSRFAA
jgi:hypothetical protein